MRLISFIFLCLGQNYILLFFKGVPCIKSQGQSFDNFGEGFEQRMSFTDVWNITATDLRPKLLQQLKFLPLAPSAAKAAIDVLELVVMPPHDSNYVITIYAHGQLFCHIWWPCTTKQNPLHSAQNPLAVARPLPELHAASLQAVTGRWV